MASLSQFGLFVVLLHVVSLSTSDDSQIRENTNTSSDALLNVPARLVALEQTVAIIVGELQEDRSTSRKKLVQKGDIVADINQGSFTIAELKMLELNDPAMVADIVRNMANSDHDFGLLMNLAKSVNNTSLRTHILTNLYYKAKESEHISTTNLIALAKCLSEKGKGYQDDRVIGIGSFKKLLDKIADQAILTFVDALKWYEDHQTNSEVRVLAADIAEWRDVSEKVMTGLVSGVFGTVDSQKILEAVNNHSDPFQALVGVGALIDRLKDAHSFQGSIALNIAFHLNDILTRENLSPTVQDYARRVKDKIPECVIKLVNLTTGVGGTVDGKKILNSGCNYIDAWHAVWEVEAIIDRLKDADSFNGIVVWDIASHLNAIVTRKNVNATVKDYARRVKDKIPQCVMELVSLTTGVGGTADSKQILKAACNYSDAWHALMEVDTIIDRLKDADSFKGIVVWDIASHINEIVSRENLNSTVEEYAHRVKDKIPECIMKLVTSTTGIVGTLDSETIFKAGCNHTDAWYALWELEVIIDRLKDADSFQGNVVWDIVAHLNEIVTRKNLNATVKDYAQTVRNKIPDCIVQLASLKKVCIWNKLTRSFLAESTHYDEKPWPSAILESRLPDHDNQRRAKWVHKIKDGRIFFENVRNEANFLQASNITEAGFNRVFCSFQEHYLDDKYAWLIETAGERCFLKNSWNNEYLFASYVMSEIDNRRIAGTKDMPSGSAENKEFAWILGSC